MKNSTMKEIHKLTPLLVEALKRKAVVFLLHRKVRGYSCIDNPVKKRMGEAWGPRTSLSALGPKVLGRRKKKHETWECWGTHGTCRCRRVTAGEYVTKSANGKGNFGFRQIHECLIGQPEVLRTRDVFPLRSYRLISILIFPSGTSESVQFLLDTDHSIVFALSLFVACSFSPHPKPYYDEFENIFPINC
jgi:hypothetical protein